jgi:hypothetical protein
MSLATFKKKTNATYKNHTVNNQKQLVLYSRDACNCAENVITGPTAAFTLNGNVRNRSYIGKSYRMSNTPGNGSHYCCGDTSHSVKPSGFTSREVMRGKKVWTKRPFTRSEIPSQYSMPSRGQLQHIHNNWVMTKGRNGGSMSNTNNSASGSQGMYLDNKASEAIRCALKSDMTGTKKCSGTTCSKPITYTKNISKGNPYSSGMYTRINRVKMADKMVVGYNKPFPMHFTMSSHDTCAVRYLQANDSKLLSTYYKDGNALPKKCL